MTGLLTLSLMRMMRLDRGFDSMRTMTAKLALPRDSYGRTEQRQSLYERVTASLRQLPGVEQAGFINLLPLEGDKWIDMLRVPGDPRLVMQLPSAHFREVSPSYFEAIHLPLLAGRTLSDGDKGKRVVLIAELTAKTMWPGRDAVGRHSLEAARRRSRSQ